MNLEIFKAYDVRGVYPSDLNEETFYKIALAYSNILKPKTVVVGMDARLSSPQLKKYLVKGLLDTGVHVVDIGGITTDMLYFAVAKYKHSGGIIVSASHNPREYNGLKLVRENAIAISSDTGLFEIRNALNKLDKKKIKKKKRGDYTKKVILNDYIQHVLSFIDHSQVSRFKFVANGNFGFVCNPLKIIAKKLHFNMVPLNLEPDGSFPKGQPDPMLLANQKEMSQFVKKHDVDFGVAWDGDADRVMFYTENGDFISGAYLSALLARIMLFKFGNDNKIIFDPRVIWPIRKEVKDLGGTPIMSKSGHAFMKDRMRAENALFTGEMSGHYYFRDNFYADNGLIPFLLVVEYLSKAKKKLSGVMKPYKEGHFMSGEINYRIKRIQEIINAVEQKYNKGDKSYIDGYSIETKNWRFNLRPSNTEPLLRLNVEAKNPDTVNRLQTEIENIIYSYQ